MKASNPEDSKLSDFGGGGGGGILVAAAASGASQTARKHKLQLLPTTAPLYVRAAAVKDKYLLARHSRVVTFKPTPRHSSAQNSGVPNCYMVVVVVAVVVAVVNNCC